MLTKNFSNYLYGCSDYSGARQNRRTASITDLTGDKLAAPADRYASTSKNEKPILIAREVFGSKYVIKSGGGTDVRYRHWIDTVLSVLHNMFCTFPVCKEVAA